MNDKIYQEEVVEVEAAPKFFRMKSARQWMQEAESQPIQKHLFGNLWFENEASVLFADTNAGKSILAVQIADSISRGVDIPPFVCDAGAQKVLYFDFELSERQFFIRYSEDGENMYQFNDNFIRLDIDSDAEYPCGDYCQYICDQIEEVMVEAGAKTAILDNITYLGEELEKSKGALPLMKRLKEIKKRHDFSFLILAHTPKRSATRPITKNDLNGSMMIMNFVDSAFAIGTSRQGKDIRYIKQLKVRNATVTYGTESVLTANIVKDENFLRFVFGEKSREVEHLEKADLMEKEEKMEIIRDLYSDGNSAREIARELDISHTQVNRLLKEMFTEGTLNKRGTGTVPKVTDVPNVPDVPPVSNDIPDEKPKKKRGRPRKSESGT